MSAALTTPPALTALQECAGLAAIGAMRPESVFEAAKDALVAGIDGPLLRRLAGGALDDLDAALDEQGVALPEAGTRDARFLIARAFARKCLEGAMTPRELARVTHDVIGHGHERELEELVWCDDEYGILGSTNETMDTLNERVLNAARQLVNL